MTATIFYAASQVMENAVIINMAISAIIIRNMFLIIYLHF